LKTPIEKFPKDFLHIKKKYVKKLLQAGILNKIPDAIEKLKKAFEKNSENEEVTIERVVFEQDQKKLVGNLEID